MAPDTADLAAAKALVLEHYRNLDGAPAEALPDALGKHSSADCRFQFVHPFRDVVGAETAAAEFWTPIRRSFQPLQRRQDIFFAGRNRVDGERTTWVVSMGHLLGLFDTPFLGLRPTRKSTLLRYAEFFRVDGGRIVEDTVFLDILNLMHQAGAEALPASTGATIVTPGPRTHDGLLFGEPSPEEGRETLDLIMRMIDRLVAVDVKTTKADLVLDWKDDMIWWGPGGIGAPYTQDRYIEQHAGPFEAGLEWGYHCGHRMQCGEGMYGGFFGWPSLAVRSTGGYIGLTPASKEQTFMRVVDLYRREGGLLAENWNFIDHLHFLDQNGLDLVARQKMLTGL